jgi:hypothetical protein
MICYYYLESAREVLRFGHFEEEPSTFFFLTCFVELLLHRNVALCAELQHVARLTKLN